VLSIKALVAFAGFFGLTGLALWGPDMSPTLRLAIASLAGIGGMLLVAFLMRSLRRLGSSGTVDPQNAVGSVGAVYLRIPAYGKGAGKVTVDVQGRSLELEAVTDGEEIPTGARVKVIGLVGSDTLKVLPA
jgi:membrane protein implicated in regulation of membrane protease activity